MKGKLVKTDTKGRMVPAEMTDRQIAEETLILLRAFGDVISALGQNPMAVAMLGGNMPKF
jgi:hypothetical protein